MTAETAMVKPSNQIVCDSKGMHTQTKKVETATNVYPGRLVMKGTNDDDIIVCDGTAVAIGWAGYEQTSKKYRPATVDTEYEANDQITVINGPGVKLVASVASGEVATKGCLLAATTAGQLKVGTAGTDQIYAVAEETVTGASTTGSDILVRSVI